MSNVVECRSTLQIIEERLVEASKPVFNLSQTAAIELCIQRRELGALARRRAEDLIECWDGSPEQVEEALRVLRVKDYLTS